MERVTVVIPTRSRYGTLRFAVHTALNQSYPNLEVIVSDNCSDDQTPRIAHEYQDPRLSYHRTPEPLSMAGNFEFAISKASPGWLVVIGDDDGLIADRLTSTIALLTRSGCRALASETAFFRWPDVRDGTGSALSVPVAGKAHVQRGEAALRFVMTGAASFNHLPLLYTGGIIHTDLVEALKAVNGRVFNADAPDVYSAIAIGRICERFLYSRAPFAITGISRSSNGGTQWNMETFTPHGAAEAFLRESRFPIHPQIPTVRNGQMPPFVPAMVYDAYLQSSALGFDLPDIDPSQQARVFLAHSYSRAAFIHQWILDFCRVNSVKAGDQRVRNAVARIKAERIRLAGVVRNALTRYRMGDHDCRDVRTVYDASIVTAFLLNTHAWAASSYLRTAQRVALRHMARDIS